MKFEFSSPFRHFVSVTTPIVVFDLFFSEESNPLSSGHSIRPLLRGDLLPHFTLHMFFSPYLRGTYFSLRDNTSLLGNERKQLMLCVLEESTECRQRHLIFLLSYSNRRGGVETWFHATHIEHLIIPYLHSNFVQFS